MGRREKMGKITFKVTDQTEIFFRGIVKKEYGEKRGAFRKAVDEAMKNWAEEKTQKEN